MHVIIWEFHVRKDRVADFERVYGPEGDWVQFFRKGDAYIGTELLNKGDGTYQTKDRWMTSEAYESFRSAYKAEYEALDRRCEALTESERQLSLFVQVE